jgi:glycosyltransferase involved in cell wall biosynthesis
MKIVLILMIKNEEKILHRCLTALKGTVDGYCILDTGSTDSSIQIAKDFLAENRGCVTEEPWQNFGYNRTVSFERAQEFCRNDGWELRTTYGLLIDADMVFVNGTLKEKTLDAVGYKALQKNGSLEYMNARLVRMDYPWKCVGVTHEYWDGPTDSLEKEVCYIDDRNDGGCKADKFTRDRTLLEDGLAKEPNNVRYTFYLAQTYSCLNMLDESITYYKKRIAQGGWFEEVWYSYYCIGDLYKRKGDLIEFEAWMLRAYAYRKQRSESLYKLAQHFRTVGEHYKAYHYIQIGQKIPYPTEDFLFIEANVYRGLFDYEASIVEYYTHENKGIGLRSSFRYLLKAHEFRDNVLQNLHFYMKPIADSAERLRLDAPFSGYTPSAVSVDIYPMANVRFINYWMEDGEYKTRGCAVDTQNAYMNLATGECVCKMDTESIPLPRNECSVKGLEDVRLYRDDGVLKCLATSVYEYDSTRVSQAEAVYTVDTGSYGEFHLLRSPFGRKCEKNWIPIPGTGMVIYEWFPLRIGSIHGDSLRLQITHDTPLLFQLFRGSAPPIQLNSGWMALVHFVEYSKPRKYYHCLVDLDSAYKPRRVSIPFVFFSASVEYCISFRKVEGAYMFFVSEMDANPSKVMIRENAFDWVSV